VTAHLRFLGGVLPIDRSWVESSLYDSMVSNGDAISIQIYLEYSPPCLTMTETVATPTISIYALGN